MMNATYQQNLITALCTITDFPTMQAFLADVMTQKELSEISSRLQAAIMLKKGEKYTTIVASTGLSSRTVARISEWLKKDSGGYATAIATINTHHEHM